ncbi:MAG: sugar transferase [Deltaproteobacteria bacterium]|nr:sugar transferase [Deltaproteobacteria bacterium]
MLKRLFDIMLSLFGLILLTPLLIFLGLLIKGEDWKIF